MKLGFHSGILNCNFPVTVVTGICRSGKSLLANILATCPECEFAEEPWHEMMLPMVFGNDLIDEDLAKQWFVTGVTELMNDLVLLRRSNFRPNDQSSIWTKKQTSEVLNRLVNIESRNDASAFVSKNNSSLLIVLAECSPFVGFIKRSIPHAKFVHVIRDGMSVAEEVVEKQWFSNEQLQKPINAQLTIEYRLESETYYCPWWVERDKIKDFIKMDEFQRSLYYWCQICDRARNEFLNIKKSSIVVAYENLVKQPHIEVEKVMSFIGFTTGAMTGYEISKIVAPTKSVNVNKASAAFLTDRSQKIYDYMKVF